VRGHWFYALFYGFASQGLLAKELCIFHSCLDHRGCHLVRFATLAGCLNQSLCGVHHPIDLLLRERWRAAHWLRQLLHALLQDSLHDLLDRHGCCVLSEIEV